MDKNMEKNEILHEVNVADGIHMYIALNVTSLEQLWSRLVLYPEFQLKVREFINSLEKFEDEI